MNDTTSTRIRRPIGAALIALLPLLASAQPMVNYEVALTGFDDSLFDASATLDLLVHAEGSGSINSFVDGQMLLTRLAAPGDTGNHPFQDDRFNGAATVGFANITKKSILGSQANVHSEGGSAETFGDLLYDRNGMFVDGALEASCTFSMRAGLAGDGAAAACIDPGKLLPDQEGPFLYRPRLRFDAINDVRGGRITFHQFAFVKRALPDGNVVIRNIFLLAIVLHGADDPDKPGAVEVSLIPGPLLEVTTGPSDPGGPVNIQQTIRQLEEAIQRNRSAFSLGSDNSQNEAYVLFQTSIDLMEGDQPIEGAEVTVYHPSRLRVPALPLLAGVLLAAALLAMRRRAGRR